MKDQRTNTNRRSALLTLTAVLLMLIVSVAGLTAIVSADAAQPYTANVTVENFTAGNGIEYDEDLGVYYKYYDKGTDADIVVNKNQPIQGLVAGHEDVRIKRVVSAVFNDANVDGASYITVTYELEGADAHLYAQPSVTLDAKILPRKINVKDPVVIGKTNEDRLVYDPNGLMLKGNSYTFASEVDGVNITLNEKNLGVLSFKAEGHTVPVSAYASTFDSDNKLVKNSNYEVVDNFSVTVFVSKVELKLEDIDVQKSMIYSGKAPVISDLVSNYSHLLTFTVEGLDKESAFNDGNVGNYTVKLSPIDTVNYEITGILGGESFSITPVIYYITFDNQVLIGNDSSDNFISVNIIRKDGDVANDDVENPEKYEILNLITYTFTDSNGNNVINPSYGTFTVKANLPTGNYVFKLYDSKDTSTKDFLTATMTVLRTEKTFDVKNEDGTDAGYDIILSNPNGFSDDVNATVTAVNGYRSFYKNTKYGQSIKITVTGADAGATFTLTIPHIEDLYVARAEDLNDETIRIYNAATDELTLAKDIYTVTLNKDDGYYTLGGFTVGDTTIVINPDYNAPFFSTVWGILLIIVIVLAILVLMVYVGLRMRRVLETRENPEQVIDTIGDLPEHEPVEVEEKEEIDVDAVLEQNVEELAETMEAEAEAAADEAELQNAVDESIKELLDEVSEEVVEEAAEEVVEEAAEEVVEEAAEEVVEEAAEEAVEEAAEEAVEEAAEEVVEEAAEEVAEEAAEEVVEEAAGEVVEEAPMEAAEESEDDNDEDDNDNDGDGEGDEEAVEAISMVEDDPFGFASRADASTFIDVKENPEAYQAMLEREARGEIKIVYRYKKSFQAKLAQSLGNVQDYYSELKNALLSFKGVKNRLSWNYEAFNRGRVHVAKMDAKSKTLYLYLALDPTQFEETKYSVKDVSAKRKYASTPTLIKIKGERKFKHALELIEKLCGEQMELVKVEGDSTDYRVERMTMDEMVDAGLMKKSAGYIVLMPETEPAAEVEEAIPANAQVDTPTQENE